MGVSSDRALRWCCWVAVALVVGMIAIFAGAGVGQDPLQAVHPPEEYAELLLAQPAALRATLGLDNVFLVLYTTAFVLLGLRLPDLRVRIGVLLLVATGLLDLVENVHFLTLLEAAEQGVLPGQTQIQLQVVESLVKFHVSYAGLFLLSLGLPRETPGQRVLSNLGLFFQLPVGVLIYVSPEVLALPLVFVRFSYFVLGLALIGWEFGPAARGARA
jgi:hypothetical protein